MALDCLVLGRLKMKSTVTVEWLLEELVEEDTGTNDPDIVDTHCFGSLNHLLMFRSGCNGPTRVGLVRDRGNDVEGLLDRCWAYVRDGFLPQTFSYGAGEDAHIMVPLKFHKELIS
jgi:hypothetical protein